jgi:hypothetical protein
MLELWNNWYETLASMEALATVIVIVVVANFGKDCEVALRKCGREQKEGPQV